MRERRISISESATCRDCVAGKYLATQGNDEEADCISCDKGKYSESKGASVCLACVAGKVVVVGVVVVWVVVEMVVVVEVARHNSLRSSSSCCCCCLVLLHIQPLFYTETADIAWSKPGCLREGWGRRVRERV